MKKLFTVVVSLVILLSPNNFGVFYVEAKEAPKTEEQVQHVEILEKEIETVELDPAKESSTPVEETDSVIEIQVQADNVRTTSVAPSRAVVCDDTNSPVITLHSPYLEAQAGGASALVKILSQYDVDAVDPEDGTIEPTNTIGDIDFSIPGFHEFVVMAVDSDGCESQVTGTVFLVSDSFAPVCENGFAYMQITIPDTLTAVDGSNTIIQSEQWIPITFPGYTFSENESDIILDNDVAITRQPSTVFINLDAGVIDGSVIAQDVIAPSIQMIGAEVVSANVFSGNVIVVDFTLTDCPTEHVCTEANAPVFTVGQDYFEFESGMAPGAVWTAVLADIELSVVDSEGNDLSTTNNLDDIYGSFSTPGTYTLVYTAIDTHGCETVTSITIVIQDAPTPPGGGGGCVTNCGGGGGGTPEPPEEPQPEPETEEPQGEILGVSTCEPLLETYIKLGADNDVQDVKDLQQFLNTYMGEELVVDGIYGPLTYEAVKRFQEFERIEVLDPWGLEAPTGYVYITTQIRINNIDCEILNLEIPELVCPNGEVVYIPGVGYVGHDNGQVLGDSDYVGK